MAGQFHVSHPVVLKRSILMGISFRDILLVKYSRGTNNCGQRVLEKIFLFHNVICDVILNERSKG